MLRTSSHFRSILACGYQTLRLFNIDRMKATRRNPGAYNQDRRERRYLGSADGLQDRIRARAKIHGDYIFGTHTTKDLDVITEGWRRKLHKVWKLCGPWKVKPEPHRFRHTFARILLQKPGVTVRNVADLMGDTEEMILKHYGAWVPERQESLTRILREAFGDTPKPRPKLVALPGRN